MNEQPIAEQENDVADSSNSRSEHDRRKDLAAGDSTPPLSEEFDQEQFAALMETELVAYTLSWNPLRKALEALARSMARQQHAQQTNNDSVEGMHDQVGSLRDQLSQVQSEKDTMNTTLTELQAQMEKMVAQMEQLQMQQQQQQQQQQEQQEQARRDSAGASNGMPAAAPSTASSDDERSSNSNKEPFATASDLAEAKRELSNELRQSLSEAFGDDGANDDDTGASRSLKRPGAPFASDAEMKRELERLQQLQDVMNDKLAAHDEQLLALRGKVSELDSTSSELASHLADDSAAAAAAAAAAANRSRAATPRRSDDGDSNVSAKTDALMNELNELRAAQEAQGQQLNDQHQTLGKYASEIKNLVQNLDDVSVQQQTAAMMYAAAAAQPTAAGASTAGDNAPSTLSRRASDAGPPQLDLSLVFTKIADLRRSTDASLDSLQSHITAVTSAHDSQQAQLDALRTGLVFNEHQRLHMIEARLAMQKELLERNQMHQNRTKPQLLEWRKALELNEEKLTQGLCDEEILQELQQLQRQYRRTYLSFSPLINSPLTIAESLQVLAEEVKQFQNGVKAGAVPLRTAGESSAGGAGSARGAAGASMKRNERAEEFTKKLRFLDEEVHATLQVNVVTEKKNDPLIKSLDAMREKLEHLSTMWYRNYTQRKRASRGPTDAAAAHGTLTDADCTPRSARSTNSSDTDGSLRELELRLMGVVRRLGLVEEDVERLSALSALNTSEMDAAARAAAAAAASNGTGGSSGLRPRSERDELDKLRSELFAELAKMAAMLGNLQATAHLGGNSTSLVPSSSSSTAGANAAQLAAARSASLVNQSDLVKELYSQMKGRELDGRFQELRDSDDVQKQLYDSFLKDVTKKVTHAVLNADKSVAGGGGGRIVGPHASGAGGAAANNVNYRLMLENFTQKVEDRLEDAREATAEELQRMKKEIADQLRLKIEYALRELRGELMLLEVGPGGDSTAMGTKPVMCVACSRPVPVSHLVREAGSLPPSEYQGDHSPPHNHGNAGFPPDADNEHNDGEYVYRAGFRMPANDRKTMTLPFLTASMRNKMVLNKPEGRRKRPARQNPNVSRVDNVVREAMELDRTSRLRTQEPQSQSESQ